jgi:hypothetical protein
MAEKEVKKKDSPSKKSEKIEKPPVDNVALANTLRKSADIVEKGDFDVLLYYTLQDFRTYYKQHLPKKKEKGKKKSKIISTTTTHVPAAAPDPPAKTIIDLKQQPTAPTEAPALTETPDATPVQESRPDAFDNTVSPDSVRLDKHASVEEFSNETSDRSERVVEPAPASTDQSSSHSRISGGIFKGKDSGMFKNKLKLPKNLPKTLPKSLPKIHVQLPTSAKKKKAERTKVEMESMTGDMAQFAESSRRRDMAQTNDLVEPNPLKPAVTGMETAITPTPLDEIPPDRVLPPPRGDKDDSVPEQPAAVNEIPASSRLLGQNNAPVATPAAVTTSTIKPATTGKSPFPSALSESFASDPPSTPEPTYIDLDIIQSAEEGMDHAQVKPAFQRPNKKNSSLIANGWIEQQRRSKMRFVWKEVLASLVEGKRPGEETTLWIQREITNATTGKKELEALHQVPVKLLESVALNDFQFSLRLYNAQDEFVFRCNASAAMNWTQTLQKYESQAKSKPPPAPTVHENGGFSTEKSFEDEKKGQDLSSSAESTRLAIRDLRAICHGAGINTAGMERPQLEAAAAAVQKRGTYFPPPNRASQQNFTTSRPRSVSPPIPVAAPRVSPTTSGNKQKASIKDLRAICHGAGISTVGMERRELEAAAAEVQKRGTYFERPKSAATETTKADDSWVDDKRKQEAIAAQQEEKRRQEDLRRRQEEEHRRRAEEEIHRRQAEEEHRRRAEEDARRRQAEQEHKRRLAEEEARRKVAEEEHRKRMAEDEHRRRIAEQQAAEQRRRYAEQQAAWQQQKQHEEQRRRVAEQQAAEQRRRHEEAVRKQQQWAAQQPQQQQQQTWAQQPPRQQPPQQQQTWSQQPPPQQAHPGQRWQQQQQWQQQQYQQQQGRPQAPQQQQQGHAPPASSPASSKYAKMANQSDDDDGQAAITKLKHDILIQWALQPPQLQMLRSIDILISTIQNVFPPALGVPAHDYFKKWKPFSRNDVLGDNGVQDEAKLKKAVRKLRFFLHPDKLPKDLNTEQQFMVKMLWDVTNDAWEEFQKSKEHLDWIK